MCRRRKWTNNPPASRPSEFPASARRFDDGLSESQGNISRGLFRCVCSENSLAQQPSYSANRGSRCSTRRCAMALHSLAPLINKRRHAGRPFHELRRKPRHIAADQPVATSERRAMDRVVGDQPDQRAVRPREPEHASCRSGGPSGLTSRTIRPSGAAGGGFTLAAAVLETIPSRAGSSRDRASLMPLASLSVTDAQ